MDLLNNLALGFDTALSLQNLAYAFIGCLLGTLIGVLPGLGPATTIAMLLPITYSLQPIAALIMLAWNQWPLTRRCLDSLLASAPFAAEVIVVDNGSSDETPAGLVAYADRVRIVALPENLGFVRGMNAGIAAARPDDDVVLLNNDLVFTQPDWLERLRDAAYAAPEHGIVGCRLLGPEAEGRINHVGGYIEADELRGQQVEGGPFERDVGQYVSTRRVQGIAFALAYVVAAAALVLLIGSYLAGALRSTQRGVIAGAAMTLVYGLLYMLMLSEDYSLLLGSIILFVALAGVMLTTRRVDWYQLKAEESPDTEE